MRGVYYLILVSMGGISNGVWKRSGGRKMLGWLAVMDKVLHMPALEYSLTKTFLESH